MTYRNLLLLGLSSIALQGCIAAAALPIVAGSGALVRNGVSDDARSGQRESVTVVDPSPPDRGPAGAPAPAPALAAAGPAATATARAEPPAPGQGQLAAASTGPVIAATQADEPHAPEVAPPPPSAPAPTTLTPGEAGLAAAPLPAEQAAATPAAAPPVASIAQVGLPPEPGATSPAELAAAESAVPGHETSQQAFAPAAPGSEAPTGPSPEDVFGQPVNGTGYGALASYALRTLGGGLPLPSAMLADPTSLQPIRRDCQDNAPTLVIDLDPAGSVVPIAGPVAVNTELARILADLRARNVQIAWITDRGPIDARAVRDRLVASGLDPASQDALYVERYPGETKQSRRTALAQTRCVIALAGDERSDFDDLYKFLRNINDARGLEMMLGNGWFLIPNPIGE